MSQNTAKIEFGKWGEDMAVRFLMKHGYSIVDRNIRSKAGEIDIIALNNEVLTFIEVKSSRQSGDTYETEAYRPEVRVNRTKTLRIRKLAAQYLKGLKDNDIAYNFSTIAFAVVSVSINKAARKGKIRFLNKLCF
ncbi:MAG: YraN family protein [Patescibacteria group bacterium]